MKNDLIVKLKILYETDLNCGFPYEDIEKMEEDFKSEMLNGYSLTADFNEFCMLIAGSASYCLSKKKIPAFQRQFLVKDFFSLYPHYSFLTQSLKNYPQFYKDLMSFENARLLINETIH